MQNAMFSGLFAALSTEHRMAIVSNNLANANTAGYKSDKAAFKDTMIFFASDFIREPLANVRSKPLWPPAELRARTRLAVEETDFSQGAMQYSGNPLDISIAGEGFFRIQTPGGNYYSRNGSFCQSADGTLMTPNGFMPLDTGGNPIQVPAGTKNVHIDFEGRIFADGAEIAQLEIVSINDLTQMEKFGHNLFRVREGSQVTEFDPRADGTLVNQGYIESSNIDIVSEMVKMIEVNRTFEANSKVMQTSDALDRESISRVGRNRS